MHSFDGIQDPLPQTMPRAHRLTRTKRHTPLAMYQMTEYTPPPIQDTPRPAGVNWTLFWKCFAALWIAGLVAWFVVWFLYGNDYSLKSSINPIRNTEEYRVFMAVFLTTVVISFGITLACVYCSWVYAVYAMALIIFAVVGGVVGYLIIDRGNPFDCKNMGNKFPMYVTFDSQNPSTATVYIHGSPIYEMKHENVDKRTYKTYISAEYLYWNSLLGKYVQKTDVWSSQTGVGIITTKLTPKAGADGTVHGTCGDGRVCLEGKIWMTPNLAFLINYTNPVTGVTTNTTWSSNEGQWYFGKKHRPLVSLRNVHGTEVFRAQSSNTVCTAGDGNMETSLVPVGLMFVAENIFKRRV